jgi:site-specific DNA-methyltransferase (adenine-specific)
VEITLKPYYQKDGITIYHGDCKTVLVSLKSSFDLIVTDPPYGIDYDSSHKKYRNGIARAQIKGDKGPFDPQHLLKFERLIIWGGNVFANRLPASPGWLVWIKTMRDDANIRQADMELAWTNCIRRPRVFHHLWIGAYKASESGERAWHPTQKPLALMRWCLGLTKTKTVCDPYLGSGTTLRAARDLGIKAIGIEVEERYCEIAARRLDYCKTMARKVDDGYQPLFEIGKNK